MAWVRTATWSATVLGAGVPGTHYHREHLLGVIAPDRQRVVPEAALERASSELLLTVRGDQGGVHIQNHDLAQVGVSDLRGRELGQLGPHVTAHSGPGHLDPL